MTPQDIKFNRDVIRRHSKSFYFASTMLPKGHREAARAVYAWCRRADDAVDEGQGDKHAALGMLRAEIDQIEDGHLTGKPVVDGFAQVLRQYNIPLVYPRELLQGMESDLGFCEYKSTEKLLEYCYRVAGTVGLMMAHVIGISDPKALEHAAHLGIAMQLTNISRDVAEDWDRERLYIPSDILKRHGVTSLSGHLGGYCPDTARSGIAGAVQDILKIAERYYESGDAGLNYLPWASSLAISAARQIYSEIGSELKVREYDVGSGRAFVSAAQKLWLSGRSFVDRTSELVRDPRGADIQFESPERILNFNDLPRL